MKSQKGSAHVVIIAVLVLTLIAALGWIFWQNFIYKEPTISNTEVVKVNQNTAIEEETSPSQSPETRLQELYDKYLADTSTYKGASGIAAFKQSGYIASDYVSENNSGEPLICGQEAYPDSIEVKLVNRDGNNAKLNADKIYSDSSKASNSLVLTMSLSSENQWQLQKTSCITK